MIEDHDSLRIRNTQTAEHRDKVRNKILEKTRGWPEREPDSKISPELSWKRLLNGKKYNVIYRDAAPINNL